MIVGSPSAAMRALAMSAALTAAAATLTACNSAAQGDSSLTVSAGDTTCALSTAKLAAGRHTISARNTGSDTTEVYIYAAGDTIAGEAENLGPALTKKLTVDLKPGTYAVACKPGMKGDGIRTALTVTASVDGGSVDGGASPRADDPLSTKAVTGYRAYVAGEATALVTSTEAFVAAVKAGDIARAKQLYGPCRLHWERIEPIAESFAALDPLIDMREDDATDGAAFVGFHKLERDLFTDADISSSAATATALLANTKKVVALIPTVEITTLTMANGSKSLLDEVAKSKVTGEEERYSHLDLVDFVGNVEGAEAATQQLRPLLAQRNAALLRTLDTRYQALITLLDSHKKSGTAGTVPGSAYVAYSALSKDEVKALAVAVDALSEPLGAVPAALA